MNLLREMIKPSVINWVFHYYRVKNFLIYHCATAIIDLDRYAFCEEKNEDADSRGSKLRSLLL